MLTALHFQHQNGRKTQGWSLEGGSWWNLAEGNGTLIVSDPSGTIDGYIMQRGTQQFTIYCNRAWSDKGNAINAVNLRDKKAFISNKVC